MDPMAYQLPGKVEQTYGPSELYLKEQNTIGEIRCGFT